MKKQLLILILIIITLLLKGQSTQLIASYMPTSPQAEAIQRYGDYAINYSIGIPDISIPLYEINHRGYKLPITLKYSPQPLRSGYNYQIFGHGWGLSVNSCISRTIEGRPDEWSNFIFDIPAANDYFLDVSYLNNYSMFFIEKNYVHDKFHATLPNGSSFDFIIDLKNGALAYTISDGRQVRIQCTYTTNNINLFEVTDEQGVKYSFADGDYPIDNTYGTANVSWQLTRIDLPNSKEPILFTYDRQIQTDTYFLDGSYEPSITLEEGYHILTVKDQFIGNKDDVDFFNCLKSDQRNKNDYKMKLLTSINYGSNTINLNYTDDKGNTYVNNISIADGTTSNRKISLCISKQQMRGIDASFMPLVQLDSLLICGSDTKAVQKYACLYTAIGCCFTGTDHWGYLNNGNIPGVANFNLYIGGPNYDFESKISESKTMSVLQKNASDPAPFLKAKLCSSSSPDVVMRQPSEPTGHALLCRLIYPTGGYTDFKFDNNRFISATKSNGDFLIDPSQRSSTLGGGFRIKNITNYTKSGIISGNKTFRYGKSESGLGVATVDPNILTYMNCSSSDNFIPLINVVLGVNNSGKQMDVDPFRNYAYNNFGYYWNCTFSASNFRRLLNGRPPVVYPVVTVYYGNYDDNQNTSTGGKTVYKYNVYAVSMDYTTSRNDSCFFESPTYYGNTLNYVPQSFLYNNLDERCDYKNENGNYTLIKKEKNQWTSNVRSSMDFIYKNDLSFGYFNGIPLNSLFLPRPIYFGISLPLSTTTTTYNAQADSITSFSRYKYNDSNQLQYRYDTCSNIGQHVKTIYTYPAVSSNGNTPAVITSMINNNIISPVLNDSVFVGNNKLYHLASGRRVDYGSFIAGSSTLLMPAKAYSLEIKSTGPQYTFQGRVVSYSANGNPLEYVTKDSVHACYIRGYNDRYQVASVLNASYNSTGDIVSGSNTFSKSKINAISVFSGTEVDFKSKLNEIRTTLPAAMVTTYTYKPLIGITSVTDPRGVTTNYSYDTFNRLNITRNDDKNIISSNRYGFTEGNSNLVVAVSTKILNYGINDSGSATVLVSGGSGGGYAYAWSLINKDNKVLQSANTSSFSFNASEVGTLTVQCVVTDIIAGKTITSSKKVNCYTLPSASVVTGAPSYFSNSTGDATVTASGGSGNYSYSWYFKDSNGTELDSMLNTVSTSYTYTCWNVGTYTILCVVTDNITKKTVLVSTTIECISAAIIGNFTLQSGYYNITNSISVNAPSVTLMLVFMPASTMTVGTSYFVASISQGCKPTANHTLTFYTDGRTWEITFNTDGRVYCKILSGSNLLSGSGAASLGPITYSPW